MKILNLYAGIGRSRRAIDKINGLTTHSPLYPIKKSMKKYQLPKKFAEKWIKALRGGKYQQATGSLIDERNHYCCLGVAGCIIGIDKENLRLQSLSKLTHAKFPAYGGKVAFDVLANNNDLQNALIQLNDGERKNFSEIANWLEQNVEFI
jgi:hypothetical protein